MHQLHAQLLATKVVTDAITLIIYFVKMLLQLTLKLNEQLLALVLRQVRPIGGIVRLGLGPQLFARILALFLLFILVNLLEQNVVIVNDVRLEQVDVAAGGPC